MQRLYVLAWRARERCADAVRTARRLFKREEGASLVEYALLVALIALVVIAAVAALGTFLNNVFTNIKTNLSSNGVS
jgi:pilus assembly protein Flp/PilA